LNEKDNNSDKGIEERNKLKERRKKGKEKRGRVVVLPSAEQRRRKQSEKG
jgi:hypothetical protein